MTEKRTDTFEWFVLKKGHINIRWGYSVMRLSLLSTMASFVCINLKDVYTVGLRLIYSWLQNSVKKLRTQSYTLME